MGLPDWVDIQQIIYELEKSGLATHTFRRLDLARQQNIINAIFEDAAAYGPASINIKRIAQKAQVSVGSLYQYFSNRENLVDFGIEMAVHYTLQSFAVFKPYLLEMPLRQALAAYLNGGVEWAQDLGGFIRFFARSAYAGEPGFSDRMVPPVAAVMLEMVKEMLAKAVERGEIRADLDLEASARVINTWLIAVGDAQLLPYLNTYFQVSGEAVTIERAEAALVQIILEGIGERPGYKPPGRSGEVSSP